MAGRKAALVRALVALIVAVPVSTVFGGYQETWWFTHGYTAKEANRSAGPDLLPMTDDDINVVLNLHGYLSIETVDNSPAVAGYDFGFHIRNDGGGVASDELDAGYLTLTKHTNPGVGPHFGLLLDGETWTDSRRDDGAGMTGGGGSTGAYDWEENDDAAISPDWEGSINYYWYNNAAANQRGLGGSRYYFEYKSPELAPGQVLEEPEAYVHFSTLKMLPLTGGGHVNFARDRVMEIRGFLIPISAVHTLPHGSLHPLFGWQSVDMADWVREKIGGLVDASGAPTPAGGLKAWANTDRDNSAPYEYVMILQLDEQIDVVGGQEGIAAQIGITSGVSRARRTYVLFKGATADNPPIDIDTPEQDGPVMVNCWGVDDMHRNGPVSLGNLKASQGTNWTVHQTEGNADDGRTANLPMGASTLNAWLKMPTMTLPARSLGVIEGKARLKLETGTTEGQVIQLALVQGNAAVASASLKVGRPPTVAVGGTVDEGPVMGSTGIPEPPTPDANGDGDVDLDDYAALVGCMTGPDIFAVAPGCGDRDLDQDGDIDQIDFGVFQRCFSGADTAFDGDCAPIIGQTFHPGSAYMDIALWYDAMAGTVTLTVNGDQLATYTSAAPAGAFVDGLYIWSNSLENIYLDSLAVFSGPFTCSSTTGDVDGDGDADAEDETARKACYSGAGKPHRTGIFPACSCLDLDGDYDVDEADGVTP